GQDARVGNREASDRYEDALADVAAVISRHDPIGLRAMGAPDDEYEPEVTDLVRLVMRSDPFGEAEVDEVWRRWFGDDYSAMYSVELAAQVADLQSLQVRYAPK
ncbi:MAG: hypothetical protein ABL966_03690, partial [Acidimicrobiales bacterium]